MVLLCKADEVSISLYERLYELSDEERKIKADKLFEKDKKTASLISGLLRRLIQKKGFKYTSISHSHSYAACMGSNVPCGLDIEKIEPKERRLVERVCTKEELKRIDASNEPDTEFIKIWTEKEASFKAGIGDGMYQFFSDNDKIEKLKKGYTYESEIFDGYVITTCEKKL